MRSAASRQRATTAIASPSPSMIGRNSCTIPEGFGSAPAAPDWAPDSRSAAIGSPAPAAGVPAVAPASVPTIARLSLRSTVPSRSRISIRTIPSRSVRALSRPATSATRATSGPSEVRSSARSSPLTKSSTSVASRLTTPPRVALAGVRRHRHERAGGHADQHQHDAEYEYKQHRPAPIATCDWRANMSRTLRVGVPWVNRTSAGQSHGASQARRCADAPVSKPWDPPVLQAAGRFRDRRPSTSMRRPRAGTSRPPAS